MFQKESFRRGIKITMTINEKLLHDINKEAAKISALSSGNIDTDKTTIASLFSRHVLNEEVICKLK